jgi:hypothetical protein
MSFAAGPVTQAGQTDLRWHIKWGHSIALLFPSVSSQGDTMHCHDPGMNQPRNDNPDPTPDFFSSMVTESFNDVTFYIVGIGS